MSPPAHTNQHPGIYIGIEVCKFVAFANKLSTATYVHMGFPCAPEHQTRINQDTSRLLGCYNPGLNIVYYSGQILVQMWCLIHESQAVTVLFEARCRSFSR